MPFEKAGLWRNWVGNQSCIARYKGAPTREEQVCEMVAEADGLDLNVRVAGSGHSFTPVVSTGGLLLSLAGATAACGCKCGAKLGKSVWPCQSLRPR